jgi:carbon-monoxide dehydrogenase large subunit
MEAGNLVGAATYDTPAVFPGDNPDGRGNLAVSYQASTHAAVVDVDPETGHVTVVDYVMADDLGRLLNPAIVRGQLVGAFAQSYGIFLGEDERFDDDGRPLGFDLVSYPLPTASSVPEPELHPVETHDPSVPGGQKGAGEIGVVNAPAAIAAAIVDAIGVELTELPLDPERVAAAIGRYSDRGGSRGGGGAT